MTPSFQSFDWSKIDTTRLDKALREALASVIIPEDVNLQQLFQWWVQTCLNSDHAEEFADSFVQWAVVDEWLMYRQKETLRVPSIKATLNPAFTIPPFEIEPDLEERRWKF